MKSRTEYIAREVPAGGTPPDQQLPALESAELRMDLAIEALDIVWPLLEKADVDAENRKIIWEAGQRLSITESVQRIHDKHPHLALELIEERLISWLEMAFAPAGYSETQLDELDRLTEKWIEDSPGRPKTGENSALLRRIL